MSIKKIAEIVGLSRHTVSDILNCNDQRYSEKTRKRVQKVAEEIGYRPNRVAQSLRLKRTRTIGVLCFRSMHELSEMRVLNVVERVNATGYLPLVANATWHTDGPKEAIAQIIEARVSGVVIANPSLYPSSEVESLLGPFTKNNIPVVALGGHNRMGIPRFVSDKREAFYQMTQHLVSHGYRRIALLLNRTRELYDDDSNWHACMAIEGYRACLKEAGLEQEEHVSLLAEYKEHLNLSSDYSDDPYLAGYKSMWHLFNSSARPLPEAVICSNDSWAYGVLRACRENRLRVPEDIAVCGMEDELSSRYGILPLTTFRQPLAQLADAAVSHLMELINNETLGEDTVKVITGELIVRASSLPNHFHPPLHPARIPDSLVTS